MTGLSVGDIISLKKPMTWEDGQKIPEWCFEKGRTFDVIQIDKRRDGRYRVVIGNPCLNGGVVNEGITGAITLK